MFQSTESMGLVLGLGVIAFVIVGVTLGIDLLNFDVIIGLLTVMTLGLLSVPVLRWVARAEGEPTLAPLLLWALVCKILFTLVRYFFITVIYGDNGDAGVYHGAAAILMESYRRGVFIMEAPGVANRGAETARIAVVLGFVYMITGVSRYAGSFVFSWLCFAGQILMFRAFCLGVPEGDKRRYALLVLFLPSLLFWPSSIGKEALMLFCIGVVCFGAAQLLGSKVNLSGILTFLAGAGGLFFIRPHMALISITALGFASAVSTIAGFTEEVDKKASSRNFAIRMVALVVLIGAAAVATTQLSEVLGDGTSGADGINGVLERTKSQTAEGGSQFEPPAVTSPLELPDAVVTVLIRPFPWEARNVNGIIASAEGVLLMALIVAGRRRLLRWCQLVVRRPYLVFAAAFAVTFIVAFSYIGNFGILARQRTQMLPLALTMLGLPLAVRTRVSWFGGQPVKVEDPKPADRSQDQSDLLGGGLQSEPVPDRSFPVSGSEQKQ